jgi:hypothetical protein
VRKKMLLFLSVRLIHMRGHRDIDGHLRATRYHATSLSTLVADRDRR